MWIVSQDREKVVYTDFLRVIGRTLTARYEGEDVPIGEFRSNYEAKEELKRFTHKLITHAIEVFEVTAYE